MKLNNKIIYGVSIVLLLLVYGLESLNLIPTYILFEGYDEMFLIIPSIISLFTQKDKKIGTIGITVGTVLFLVARNIISFKLIIPIILAMYLFKFLIDKSEK